MKKIIILSFLIGYFSFSALADEPTTDTSYWKTKYESALGFSQTTLTNWAKGGEKASFSSNFLLNIYKEYARKNVTWNSYLGIAYGISRNQSVQGLRKTNDMIDLLTKFGLTASKRWNYTGLFEFKSQFSPGYAYPNDSVPISKFMAPGYFQLSLGMNYKPVEYFAVFISPGGSRLTVVNDTSLTMRPGGAFGIYGDNNTLWQVGGSINAIFKKDVFKNVNLFSKLDIFSNYMNRPEKVVFSWENNILMKVNKYLAVNLSTMMIYDQNAIDKDEGGTFKDIIQFRETFGIGLAYTIFR